MKNQFKTQFQSQVRSNLGFLIEDTLHGFKEFAGPLVGMLVIVLMVTGTYKLFLDQRLSEVATSISADINNPEVAVRTVGQTIILEGTAQDKSESDRCEAIALDYVSAQKAQFAVVSLVAPKVINLISIKGVQKTASLD